MKKRWLAAVLFVCVVFFVSGDTAEQEEIDYLLFLPDSGSLFVDEKQAMVQLDNLAKYLTDRDLVPGQIYVYGYAAFALNDIEPVNLSRDRAHWVISELQKRGVPRHLFSDPVGHGSVDLWGSNTDEEGRSPNRRVRVVLDGKVLTVETLRDAEPEIIIAIDEAPIRQESAIIDESKFKFPWWILLLLPLLGLLFLLHKLLKILTNKKNVGGKTPKPEKAPEKIKEPTPVPVPAPAPVAAKESVTPIAVSTVTVNLEEEIRFRAYELYLRRNGQSEDHYEDWCRAVFEISAQYEADGYQVYRENENWWARKSTGRKH
jgi:hypothetical protein